MESIKIQPIGTITANNVGNTELREVLHEYFGKNENSYTADLPGPSDFKVAISPIFNF